MYPYVNCHIIYYCQDLDAAQGPISRWMDLRYIYIMEYYSAKKKKRKEEILLFATAQMDLEIIMLSEVR